jgi:hypothetical protein
MSTEARSVKPLNIVNVTAIYDAAVWSYDIGELKSSISSLDVVALCKLVWQLEKKAAGLEEQSLREKDYSLRVNEDNASLREILQRMGCICNDLKNSRARWRAAGHYQSVVEEHDSRCPKFKPEKALNSAGEDR